MFGDKMWYMSTTNVLPHCAISWGQNKMKMSMAITRNVWEPDKEKEVWNVTKSAEIFNQV